MSIDSREFEIEYTITYNYKYLKVIEADSEEEARQKFLDDVSNYIAKGEVTIYSVKEANEICYDCCLSFPSDEILSTGLCESCTKEYDEMEDDYCD